MYTVIQFIQLCSLYSYSFKQIMSAERPSTARLFPYEHHFDSPLPTLRKILKFLKWWFFALFFEKNQKYYYFLISLVEIWLV